MIKSIVERGKKRTVELGKGFEIIGDAVHSPFEPKKIRAVREKIVYPVAAAVFLGLVLLLIFSVVRASLFTEVDEHKRVWFDVTFLLFTAIVAELLIVYLRQPVVMVLLIVGVLISPSAIELAWPLVSQGVNSVLGALSLAISLPAQTPHFVSTSSEVVRIFAQLGSIILLFKIGLHSEVKEIFNMRNLIVALLGVVLPFAGGYLYAIWAGDSFTVSLFLGAALTATSVGVTVGVLKEFGVLQKDFAKLILGAAVIDDVLALLALSLVTNLPQKLDAASLSPIVGIAATAIVFIVGGILLGRYVAKRYFDNETESREGAPLTSKTIISMLCFALLYAYVAEFIGLSAIVGAFIAGVTLNYSRIVNRIYDAMLPLEALFTPIFFISLGMYVDIGAVSGMLVPLFIVSVIAVGTKIIGCGAGALLGGVRLPRALLVGVGMVPRGEVALIIGLIGLGGGLLTAGEYSLIASMAFVTTVIVPPALQLLISREETV
jgi:Kef-type K+ transport system membrane component KefB